MGITIDRNGREHADTNGHLGYEPGAFLPVHDEVSAGTGRRLVNPKWAEVAAFDRLNSRHQGTIGDRFSAEVTIFKVILLNGFYGPQYLTIARDFGGNVFVAKTSQRWAREEETVRIKAAIKAHDLRDGVEQTIINRVKIY